MRFSFQSSRLSSDPSTPSSEPGEMIFSSPFAEPAFTNSTYACMSMNMLSVFFRMHFFFLQGTYTTNRDRLRMIQFPQTEVSAVRDGAFFLLCAGRRRN